MLTQEILLLIATENGEFHAMEIREIAQIFHISNSYFEYKNQSQIICSYINHCYLNLTIL